MTKLQELALEVGILPSYEDVRQRNVQANPKTLVQLLHIFNVKIGDQPAPAEIQEHLNSFRYRKVSRLLDYCSVCVKGSLLKISIPFKSSLEVGFTVASENDDFIEWEHTFTNEELIEEVQTDKGAYRIYGFRLPQNLPHGYYTLTAELGEQSCESLLLVPPAQCYVPKNFSSAKSWSVFAPVYALRSNRNSGVGDWADLKALGEWVLEKGGAGVATLPMHCLSLEGPGVECSPYSPFSRLFWNELYLDLDEVTDLDAESRSRYQQQVESLRTSKVVEYATVWQLKKAALMEAFKNCDKEAFEQRKAHFGKTDPLILEFANFRAAQSKECSPDFYLYIQALAQAQLEAVSDYLKSRGGMGLYLDLPLGSHRNSFDTFYFKESFANDVAIGAPPDLFFSKGQNWGLPPIHPQKLRQHRYTYFRDLLTRNMSKAGVLRVDHIMGFHRQYWIPNGNSGADGAYVTYPHEEIYAILAIESHRHKCAVIGEDLGTVDPEVRKYMKSKGVFGMYVLQLEALTTADLPAVGTDKIVSLNTHDTSTFNAFWTAADVDLRRELSINDAASAETERRERRLQIKKLKKNTDVEDAKSVEDVIRAEHRWLAKSQSPHLVINLEDLWSEERPQNVPGTSTEFPNWQRKMKLDLQEIKSSSSINKQLEEIDRVRS